MSSFPKRVKRLSRKGVCDANAKFIDYVLEKNSLHMNICVYMYIFMKSSFSKHDLQNLYWNCNLDFFIGAYRVLEKSYI